MVVTTTRHRGGGGEGGRRGWRRALVATALSLACLALVRSLRPAWRVEDLGLPPVDRSRFDVEDNFDNRGGFFATVADNWQQRGALVKRAADLEDFPTGFSGKRIRGGSQLAQELSKVSGDSIVGDAARVDQPGKGELIWSEDGTPVQPTPWDLQWDGGAPAWAENTPGDLGDGQAQHDRDMDEAQDAEEREAEAFAAPPPDESSPTFDVDFERVSRLASSKRRPKRERAGARGSRGKPQEKHMWQYWATKEDDLKARVAGKVAKKAWELQRKYLKKMKDMCPFCSAMPGPKELSKMFCRTCEQFPESWGDKLINGKPGARGEPFSGSPPNYLNDDDRPLHHTPMDKGTWWGDNDAWYDGWEQHRVDLWPPYKGPYTDEDRDGKMLKGGGWKAMADDLNRGGNDYPEYKRTGMAPEYWERPGNEHDLDNPGKTSHMDAHEQGEEFLDAGEGGEITGGTSFKDDWETVRPIDKLPPWCDRILGCPPPYNDIGEQDLGRSADGKTTWSWPYNENGKKIQLGDHGRALLKEKGSAAGKHGRHSVRDAQAKLLESQAEGFESEIEPRERFRQSKAQDVKVDGDVRVEADAVLAKADDEAADGAASVINEPLQAIASSVDSSGEKRHGPAAIPLYPPWAAHDDAQQTDGDDFPGFRESEWTGDDEQWLDDGGPPEDDELDEESRRDRLSLSRDHPARSGWKGPVGGADQIGDFRVRRSTPQTLSQKSLASELEGYLDAWEGSRHTNTR